MSAGGEPNRNAEAGRVQCPVCGREFPATAVEDHVNRCLFLNTPSSKDSSAGSGFSPTGGKRPATGFLSAVEKKHKISQSTDKPKSDTGRILAGSNEKTKSESSAQSVGTPLAEVMRPSSLETYVGQRHVLAEKQMLRELLEKGDVPSMVLWGPPGCGKTSLANVVAEMCKERHNMRFVKLSATMAGIANVKEVVTQAKNELRYKRRTILFMDEIHRFNKLQQDAFLPHVENGTIVLLGATTENPSFSLNTALLSRCRVVVLEKLSSEDVLTILERALRHETLAAQIAEPGAGQRDTEASMPRVLVERASLSWLAEVCDGDARVALGGLQLALQAADPGERHAATAGPSLLTLQHIMEGIKRSHTLYSRKGDQHYDMVSALHKCVRASDDNAALYWLTRMLQGGEDPIFIARRLVRAASEDIGLADPTALPLAVSCMQGCQLLGMPECDVLLAQCAVHLARAPKSQEVYRALLAAKSNVNEHKGPLPAVPLHLRNAPTKLMKQLGYGAGYNMRHKDQSNLLYMPEELQDIDFFHNT